MPVKGTNELSSVDPVADFIARQVPETWHEAFGYFLDHETQLIRHELLTCEMFKQDDLCDRLGGLAQLRTLAEEAPLPTHRVVDIPLNGAMHRDKLLHLARVLTPQGWRDTFRYAVVVMRDTLLDAGRKEERGTTARREKIAAAGTLDYFLSVLDGMQVRCDAINVEIHRQMQRGTAA